MKNLTVRNVDPELADALERERCRTGASLNQTILNLLRRVLGCVGEGPFSNGLGKLAGNWSEEDFQAFESACRDFGKIDEDLWK